jgi:hypothetical protein
MEIHKPRETEKGISERGNNNTRLGRVLHETAGREKGRRKGRNRNEEEADGARESRNQSRRGRETNKEAEKEKGKEGRSAEGIVERMIELMNGVWRGERFPIEWREGVIPPIYKKGEKSKTENYRGITVLNTGYNKFYLSILKEEIEEKEVVLESHARKFGAWRLRTT